jgi:uncharacterized membrane protein YjjP (DUF1212 family)
MSAAPDQPKSHAQSAGSPDEVSVLLLAGRMLFNFGATAQRIQDSIIYLARYLGCKVDLLVSYDALVITVNNGKAYRTQIDSARGVAGLNLLGLVRVSEVLRRLPASPPSAEDLEQALVDIRDAPAIHSFVAQVLAAGCAGAAFCIVNGGDPASWLGGFAAAAAIFTLRRPLSARHFNIHLVLFTIALAGGLLAVALSRITHTTTPAVALVGPVLFLVPGAPMINGGIDVVRNHMAIGIARVGFTLAVLIDLCLAMGITVTLLPSKTSPTFSLPGELGLMTVSLAGALAAGALACLNNGSLPLMALCTLGGLTGRLVRGLLSFYGSDPITASLIGALCSTLVVGYIAERRRWPAVVASVIAALPMVPGYFAIAGLHSLLLFAAAKTPDSAQLAIGLQALARALFISIALVLGVIGPVIILQRNKERI